MKVTWSSPAFEYTHQKTVVVDGSTALIMTANLTSRYYAVHRDFLIEDTKPADLAAITAVFNADFAHRSIQPSDGRDLVSSPANSQATLLALVNGARHSLRIYSEEMGDATIEAALIKAAHRGVSVKLCAENEDSKYNSTFTRLAKAGVKISYYSSPSGFYIHGKVIGTNTARTGHGRSSDQRIFPAPPCTATASWGWSPRIAKCWRRWPGRSAATFSRGTRWH